MKKGTRLIIATVFSVFLGTGLALGQVTYNGNGNSGFGGPIGGSTLSFTNNGTTVTGTLTKGGGDFNDTFVIYISNGSSGRSSIGTAVNDRQDANRSAISYIEASKSKTLTFPSGFEATHAIAINTTFGGLWSIPNSGSIGNNGLTFVTGLGGDSKPSSASDASFTFSFDLSDIGLDDNGANGFKFVAIYLNPFGGTDSHGFVSNEGYGSGFSGSNVGQENFTFSSFESYASAYISGDAGWRLLSLPKTGGTVEDISDDSPVQGVTGGDDTGAEANFIIYDSDATFEQPTNVSTAWGDGLGFGLYFFDNTTNGSSELPVTLDASGSEPSSDVDVTLNPAASGYTLVGNPFASNYNTNSITATSSNISNTIAFWNDGTSSYSTQDRTDPYIIAPWQGFWVQTVSASATTLTFPTSGKTSTSTSGTFFSKQNANKGDIKFTFSSENSFDEALRLSFRENATTGYDKDDFGKLIPLTSNYATMAFKSNDLLKSVESLPWNLEEEINLALEEQLVGVSGEFTLDWKGIESIPADWNLTFHDYETGSQIDMRAIGQYVFTAEASSSQKVNPLTILDGPAAVTQKSKSTGNRFGITITPSTSVSNEPTDTPITFGLEQNYPNPFNPSTTIKYSVGEAGPVTITVYNVMGQKVAELLNTIRSAGEYQVTWNADNQASGIYYYRLTAPGQVITRQMTLIK